MKFRQYATLLFLISTLFLDSMTWRRRRRRRAVQPGCSTPPYPSYSARSGCSSPYTHGETCHYRCRSGYYRTSGASELTCSLGSWIGVSLVCSPVGCSTPPIPPFSYKSGCSSPYSHGKTCYYGCHSGYYPASGNTERTCSYGSWTGENLDCRKESSFSAAWNVDVEIVFTYRLETGITPLFENWKKLPRTGIASRTTANVYTAALYKGRIELFGQASLRLKNSTTADEGTYQLFTVFSDGTVQTITASVEVDDPCEDNDCSSDGGKCVPQGHNFTCFCGPGYIGDGWICREIIPGQPWTTDATTTTDGWTGRTQATDLQTIGENRTFPEDSAVVEVVEGLSAELHWNYSHTPNTNVIFEAWWFKTNGNDLFASRVHPLNISISPSYEERLEESGDTNLLLKEVGLADVGTYQLLAAFNDVSEPLRKNWHLVVQFEHFVQPASDDSADVDVILTITIPLSVILAVMAGILLRCCVQNRKKRRRIQDIPGEQLEMADRFSASPLSDSQTPDHVEQGSANVGASGGQEETKPQHSVTVDRKFPIIHSKQLKFEESIVARGGFAFVRKARHLGWRKNVAVKCLLNGRRAGDEQDELYSEARKLKLASKSDHVISLLGVCLEPNFAIVMPYMENGSLAGLLRDVDVPWALRWRMAHEISLGMTFLHCQNPQILHCDLKAENVLLDGDFRVKISDFGLSKWKTGSRVVTTKSPEGGTTTHAPPEYFSDINLAPTEKFDVYSFGVLLWEIVTRTGPYMNAMNTALIRVGVSSGQRPDLTQIPTDLPYVETVCQLMKKCWSQNPEDRPSFQECEDYLRAVNNRSSKQDILQAIINVQEMKACEK